MTQQTKEVLKEQSAALLETAGNNQVDLIDSFVTEADLYRSIAYTYTGAGNAGTSVRIRRSGNVVYATGLIKLSEDVENDGTFPNKLLLEKGYGFPYGAGTTVINGRDEDGLSFLGTLGFIGLSPRSLSVHNNTGKTLKAGTAYFINAAWITTDAFPDDSVVAD